MESIDIGSCTVADYTCKVKVLELLPDGRLYQLLEVLQGLFPLLYILWSFSVMVLHLPNW